MKPPDRPKPVKCDNEQTEDNSQRASSKTNYLTSTSMSIISIGWNHFLLGQMSRKWEEAQSLWYRKLKQEKAKVEKHLTGIFWARKIIANTVYLTLNRWQLHNDYLHNISCAETYTKERETYLRKITSIMDKRHSLPNDPRLRQFFSGEIRNAQTLPLARLKEWHKGYESMMEIISSQLITRYTANTFSPPSPG